jgi:4-hydroxybenzoate polyprenyltransferase
MNRWLSLAYKMLRPRTVAMMLMFAAIGDAATKTSPDFDYRFGLMALLLGCLFIVATTTNDIADEEIDKINLANDVRRPLAVDSAQTKHLVILGLVAFFAAVLLALVIRPWLVIVAVIAAGLSYIYSMPPIKISHRGILAPLLLPINYVVLPFTVGASIHQEISTSSKVLLAGLYISFIGRIILKDFRDVKGDKMFGKRTFIVRYGAANTCRVAAIAWLIGDLIISYVFIRTEPLLVVLLQPFVVAIFWTLKRLGNEKALSRQLTLVNLVGRLGNSVAMGVLTVLTLELYDYGILKNSALLVLVMLVNIYTAYVLFELYMRQRKPQ